MTLSVETTTDSIEVHDDDESIVSLHRDDSGIVVRAEQKLVDGSTGESITRKIPVEFIAYARRKLQDPDRFYEAVQQKVERYVQSNTSSDLHGVWSVSKEVRKELERQEKQVEGDVA